MRTRILGLAGTAFGLALTLSAPATAAPITIGDPSLVPYTLTYGDFQIVSLEFADDGTGTKNYFVQSSPGQLKDNIVVGSGPGNTYYNGKVGDVTSLAGSDAPYNTETGSTNTFFRTGGAISAPDPGASQFSGDSLNSWDITTADLRTYLGAGNAPVFYFNLNEKGTDDTLSGTDILIWMKLTLTGSAGTQDFYLAGNPFDPLGAGYGKTLSLGGGPNETLSYPDLTAGDPPTFDPTDHKWTFVHGNICVDGSDFLHYGSCNGDPTETGRPGAHSVKQNQGSDQAAFAGYNELLNSLIMDPNSGYDTLHIDWRMADTDNGYEQLFILASGATQILIPEPATLALFGAGLAGLGLLYRRRKNKA